MLRDQTRNRTRLNPITSCIVRPDVLPLTRDSYFWPEIRLPAYGEADRCLVGRNIRCDGNHIRSTGSFIRRWAIVPSASKTLETADMVFSSPTAPGLRAT